MKLQPLMVLMSVALIASFCFECSLRAERVPRIELVREIHVPGSSPHSDILTGFVAPDHASVSRDTRPITLTEVYDAISKSLTPAGVNQWSTLRPEDLLLQTQVLVAPGDAGLEVLRSMVDPGLRRARFLLWPANDPKVLPFIVTARLDPYSPIAVIQRGATSGQNTNRTSIRTSIGTSIGTGSPNLLVPVRQAILLTAGKRATLVVHSGAIKMLTDVIPLEPGALGQRIRVRLLDTGKILSAQVDGPGHLEVKF